MSINFLDFERPIAELDAKIRELRLLQSDSADINILDEIEKLEKKNKELIKNIFKALTPWQIVQLSRHPSRPYSLDYIMRMITEFTEIHGDRRFGNDKAIVAGLGKFDEIPVAIIAHQKGRDSKEKVERNFAMPHPEGYRKALRVMQMAEKFGLPLLCFIDTQGAYPGVGAEERGQSEAIAACIQAMSQLAVPIICTVIGEGCSGGALGIGVGDVMLIMQYAYFATISPEGCSSILWKSSDKAQEAAQIMGITADKLLKLGIVDKIIEEPVGGAHRDLELAAKNVKRAIESTLKELLKVPVDELVQRRYRRLMDCGKY